MRPDLAVSSDDLSGGHLPAAEPLHEHSDFARADQVKALQEDQESCEKRDQSQKHDSLRNVHDLDHVLPPIRTCISGGITLTWDCLGIARFPVELGLR